MGACLCAHWMKGEFVRKGSSKKGLLVGLLAVVMAMTIALPGAAFAAGGGSSSKDMGASWSVPTTPMTNTIEKNGKTYKVVTTWAMAWSTSGPDFLGVNNSSFYGNGGNGNANVTNTTIGATQTLLGIWASSANESPNAFNWNSFYNLYADEQTAAGNALAKTDLACTTASWDTSSGVYGPFKYRPEIIWLCNNLSAAQTAEYVGYINAGKYVANQDQITSHTEGEGNQKKTIIDSIADPTAEQKAQFYVAGDETYAPKVIQPVNSNAFAFVESGYELANLVDQVIAETANNGQLSASEINWKTMNSLPRATRYNESAQDCALNIERLARGSVYYTLSKIADNTVARKKVAYVSQAPGKVDDTHVSVVVMDYMDSIGNDMQMNGVASWSPLVVDQLGADGKLDVYNNVDHSIVSASPSTGEATQITRPVATYSHYLATADDLLSCDVLFEGRNVSYSVADFREWLSTNATTAALKEKAKTVGIVEGFPYVCNGSNYTMDKLIYGAYSLDCIYPELFPNMENSTFWYNKVYHIKNTMLGSAMSWAFAVATLPAGTELPSTEAGIAYSADNTIAKYDAGLAYFQANKGTDATLKRILSSTALDGSTSKDGTAYNYTNFEPSALWIASAKSEPVTPAKAAQTVTFKNQSKTVKASKVKKANQTVAITKASAKTKVTYAISKVNKSAKKFSINKSSGKITVKKGLAKGTYKVTVKASAAETSAYKAANKSATITIKVK